MEINGLVQWLFKWWVIVSAVFWVVVGAIYYTLLYVTYRNTGQWPS